MSSLLTLTTFPTRKPKRVWLVILSFLGPELWILKNSIQLQLFFILPLAQQGFQSISTLNELMNRAVEYCHYNVIANYEATYALSNSKNGGQNYSRERARVVAIANNVFSHATVCVNSSSADTSTLTRSVMLLWLYPLCFASINLRAAKCTSWQSLKFTSSGDTSPNMRLPGSLQPLGRFVFWLKRTYHLKYSKELPWCIQFWLVAHTFQEYWRTNSMRKSTPQRLNEKYLWIKFGGWPKLDGYANSFHADLGVWLGNGRHGQNSGILRSSCSWSRGYSCFWRWQRVGTGRNRRTHHQRFTLDQALLPKPGGYEIVPKSFLRFLPQCYSWRMVLHGRSCNVYERQIIFICRS